jgi:hypothetical protein
MLQAVVVPLALAAFGAPTSPATASAGSGSPSPAAPDPLVALLVAGVDATLRDRPDDGVAHYQRARLASEARVPADALPYLERLDAIGCDVLPSPEHFGAFARDARFRALAARIEARVSRSTLAFSVPEPDLVPEGIAVDPRMRTFYLGSIRKR